MESKKSKHLRSQHARGAGKQVELEEVHDIVQEVVTKIIPKKMKCKKAEWFSEEALQIFEKRRR